MGVTAPSRHHHRPGLEAVAFSGDQSPGGQQAAWGRLLKTLGYAGAAIRKIGPREHIFALGDACEALHVLLGGWAYVFRPLEDGHQVILQFAEGGTVIGFHPEANAMAKYSARTLCKSTIAIVSFEKLQILFESDPGVAMLLTGLLSRDRELAFDSVTSFCRNSGRERVARLLLQFVMHSRASTQEDVSALEICPTELFVPLAQEHIADATGLSTGHVNRILTALRKDGAVEFQYRKLRILNLGRLLTAAGAPPLEHPASPEAKRSIVAERGNTGGI